MQTSHSNLYYIALIKQSSGLKETEWKLSWNYAIESYILLAKFIRQHLVKTEFSKMFEMPTFRNHKKYDPFLLKKHTNYLVVSWTSTALKQSYAQKFTS